MPGQDKREQPDYELFHGLQEPELELRTWPSLLARLRGPELGIFAVAVLFYRYGGQFSELMQLGTLMAIVVMAGLSVWAHRASNATSIPKSSKSPSQSGDDRAGARAARRAS